MGSSRRFSHCIRNVRAIRIRQPQRTFYGFSAPFRGRLVPLLPHPECNRRASGEKTCRDYVERIDQLVDACRLNDFQRPLIPLTFENAAQVSELPESVHRQRHSQGPDKRVTSVFKLAMMTSSTWTPMIILTIRELRLSFNRNVQGSPGTGRNLAHYQLRYEKLVENPRALTQAKESLQHLHYRSRPRPTALRQIYANILIRSRRGERLLDFKVGQA